ncbi:NADP-specific glutamate dehydrogenase [Klebsiella quasipneumoniae subsp. similipneumoniae]|nr:NADP-specific glutamate dehydrogenase [Klebsiella quasipneumoniae subsp. similipneumoniae]
MDQTCTLEGFLTRVQQRDPHQTEFAQAVREVMTTLWPFLEENPRYRQLALLERLVEPERVIQFRVVGWTTAIRSRSTARGACSSTRPSARIRAECASTRR